jgi:hypothetical protein
MDQIKVLFHWGEIGDHFLEMAFCFFGKVGLDFTDVTKLDEGPFLICFISAISGST